jgi:hypothetical protein
MDVLNLTECLEPGVDKYERIIFRKAVLIDSKTSKIFITEYLRDKSQIFSAEELPSQLPPETAIRLSTDDYGSDRLEVIMNGEQREVLSKESRDQAEDYVDEEDNDYPVEALYTEINGFGIRAEFNRENAIKGDVKAVLQITSCVDAQSISDSVL